MKKQLQNATRNNFGDLIEVKKDFPDTISFWIAAYFRFEVTTSESSQRVQQRDLTLFRDFLLSETGSKERRLWTPRQSRAFYNWLKKKNLGQGRRGYNGRTINRIMAHLKTLDKWIHKLKPFPLGNPMAKMKLMPIGNGLEIVRFLERGYPRSKFMWPKKEPSILRNGNRRRCFFRRPPTPMATVG